MDKMSTDKIVQFWLKYEQKIVLVVAFCLISAISFQFGVFQGQKLQPKPLIIEKAVNIPSDQASAPNEASVTLSKPAQTPALLQQPPVTAGLSVDKAGCAFVGSKNSTKFYVPTCSWAKRIKPENLVCYQSEQEAVSKGKTKSNCQ